MKRLLVGISSAALFMATVAGTSASEVASVHGYIVTCPAGDPIPNAPLMVFLFVNGQQVEVRYLNAGQDGRWTTDFTITYCDPLSTHVTAILGQTLHQPYYQDYCPGGKNGSPPTCCVQVQRQIDCGSNPMANLELRCGVAGSPPCPSQ